MIRNFSVSMPRAGHHVMEMVLRGLLGARFAYCEFYTVADCCRAIPCAKTEAHARDGALLFMQKSHDHQLADPVPEVVDAILVQVREPVRRALSNYELDIAGGGVEHSRAYQLYWLGGEAAYADGFFRKWRLEEDGRALALRYEDLLADPVGHFSRFFDHCRLPRECFDASAILEMQSKSSSGDFKFRNRTERDSPYYDEALLRHFGRLVSESARWAGYPTVEDEQGGADFEAMRLVFEGYKKLYRRDFQGAIECLNAYMETESPYRGALYHPRLHIAVQNLLAAGG